MSPREIQEYLEDIAKLLRIDLSIEYDDNEIQRIFDKMTTPLSEEIIRNRGEYCNEETKKVIDYKEE